MLMSMFSKTVLLLPINDCVMFSAESFQIYYGRRFHAASVPFRSYSGFQSSTDGEKFCLTNIVATFSPVESAMDQWRYATHPRTVGVESVWFAPIYRRLFWVLIAEVAEWVARIMLPVIFSNTFSLHTYHSGEMSSVCSTSADVILNLTWKLLIRW